MLELQRELVRVLNAARELPAFRTDHRFRQLVSDALRNYAIEQNAYVSSYRDMLRIAESARNVNCEPDGLVSRARLT